MTHGELAEWRQKFDVWYDYLRWPILAVSIFILVQVLRTRKLDLDTLIHALWIFVGMCVVAAVSTRRSRAVAPEID